MLPCYYRHWTSSVLLHLPPEPVFHGSELQRSSMFIMYYARSHLRMSPILSSTFYHAKNLASYHAMAFHRVSYCCRKSCNTWDGTLNSYKSGIFKDVYLYIYVLIYIYRVSSHQLTLIQHFFHQPYHLRLFHWRLR